MESILIFYISSPYLSLSGSTRRSCDVDDPNTRSRLAERESTQCRRVGTVVDAVPRRMSAQRGHRRKRIAALLPATAAFCCLQANSAQQVFALTAGDNSCFDAALRQNRFVQTEFCSASQRRASSIVNRSSMINLLLSSSYTTCKSIQVSELYASRCLQARPVSRVCKTSFSNVCFHTALP